MRKIIFFCLVVMATLPAVAQKTKSDRKEERKKRVNALIKQEEEGVIAYRKQSVFGFKLTNDGYGGFYEFGRAQSVNKSLLFQFDFAERKHSKEQKQTNPFLPTSPFIFGKINFFYPLNTISPAGFGSSKSSRDNKRRCSAFVVLVLPPPHLTDFSLTR